METTQWSYRRAVSSPVARAYQPPARLLVLMSISVNTAVLVQTTIRDARTDTILTPNLRNLAGRDAWLNVTGKRATNHAMGRLVATETVTRRLRILVLRLRVPHHLLRHRAPDTRHSTQRLNTLPRTVVARPVRSLPTLATAIHAPVRHPLARRELAELANPRCLSAPKRIVVTTACSSERAKLENDRMEVYRREVD